MAEIVNTTSYLWVQFLLQFYASCPVEIPWLSQKYYC